MEQTNKKGFIYILINPAFTGYVKIGKTIRTPETRARELSSKTGVPAPYAVAWEASVKDCDTVERLIHKKLASYRARNDREFFSIPLKDAISSVTKIARPFYSKESRLSKEVMENIEKKNRALKYKKQYGNSDNFGKEELILIAEDSSVNRSKEPSMNGPQKTIKRIVFEVLIENPYTYTERELFYEVHVVRRNKPHLKIETYNIKRSPLVQDYGWGIHRDIDGKLALVPVESQQYQRLQRIIKNTKSYRKNKT